MKNHIQVVRGISVSSVLLFHFWPEIFDYGYLGVDVFFVISGYVIAIKLSNDSEFVQGSKIASLKKFYRRRFYRLAPALGTVIVCTLCATLLLSNVSDFRTSALQGLSALFSLGNFGAYYLDGNYFDQSNNPLLHTWSLGAEEQIYLVLPIVIWLIFKLRSGLLTWMTTSLVAIAMGLIFLNIPNLFSNFPVPQDWDAFSFYSPFLRFSEVALGVAASRIPIRSKRDYLPLFLFPLTLLMFFQVFMKQEWILISSSLVFLGLLLHAPVENLSKFFRPFVWLGTRSYSVYLVHLPVMILLPELLHLLGVNLKSITEWLFIPVSLYLGHLVFSRIEIRYLASAPQAPRFKQVFFIFLVFPVMFCLSLYFIQADSMSRFQKESHLPEYGKLQSKECSLNESGLIQCGSGKHFAILLGDSHAEMYSQAFYEIVKKNRTFIDASLTSCRFVATNSVSLTDDCNNRNRLLKKFIRKNKSSVLFYAEYFKSGTEVHRALSNLKKISPSLEHVYVIGPNPVWPDGSSFLKSGRILIPSPPPIKSSPIANFEFTKQEIQLKFAVRETSNFTLMGAREVFCADGICRRMSRKDEWLYIDDNHLSYYGAKKLAEYYHRLLEKK